MCSHVASVDISDFENCKFRNSQKPNDLNLHFVTSYKCMPASKCDKNGGIKKFKFPA